jgi:hypothetical protein
MATYEGSDGGRSSSTTHVAKDQATQVGQSAAQAGGEVAQTTKEQAKEVVAETTRQARDLAGEARSQVRQQANGQRDRAVGGLRTLGDELNSMAEQGGQSGVATEVARQLSTRANDLAGYLEQREPGDLVNEVRDFARRRPGVFLLGAALAGVAAGRLVKGATAARSSSSSSSSSTGTQGVTGGYAEPAYPSTGTPAPGTVPGYQPGYADQPGYAQPGYSEPAYPAATPGYAEQAPAPGYTEPGYVEPEYVEPGYVRPGYSQPGYQEPGYAEPGVPPRGPGA